MDISFGFRRSVLCDRVGVCQTNLNPLFSNPSTKQQQSKKSLVGFDDPVSVCVLIKRH
jgi:hypothetical protein